MYVVADLKDYISDYQVFSCKRGVAPRSSVTTCLRQPPACHGLSVRPAPDGRLTLSESRSKNMTGAPSTQVILSLAANTGLPRQPPEFLGWLGPCPVTTDAIQVAPRDVIAAALAPGRAARAGPAVPSLTDSPAKHWPTAPLCSETSCLAHTRKRSIKCRLQLPVSARAAQAGDWLSLSACHRASVGPRPAAVQQFECTTAPPCASHTLLYQCHNVS